MEDSSAGYTRTAAMGSGRYCVRFISQRFSFPSIFFTHDGSDLYRKWNASQYLEKRAEKEKYKNKKVILLIRNALDTVVSSFWHVTKRHMILDGLPLYHGSLDDFVFNEKFGLPKIVAFYSSWYRAQHIPKDFLLVSFERLRRDTIGELSRIIQFLELPMVPAGIESTVENTRFEKMKKREQNLEFEDPVLRPADPNDPMSYKVRKGKIGGFKEELSLDTIAKAREYLLPYRDRCFPELFTEIFEEHTE